MLTQELETLNRKQLWDIIDRDGLPVRKFPSTVEVRAALIAHYQATATEAAEVIAEVNPVVVEENPVVEVEVIVESPQTTALTLLPSTEPTFELYADEFHRALKCAQLSDAPTMLLQLGEREVIFRSFMGGLGVEYRQPCEVVGKGAIVIPKAAPIPTFAKGDILRFNIESDIQPLLKLAHANGNYNCHGMAPDEYPVLPVPKTADVEIVTTLTYSHLKQLISECAFSTADKFQPLYDGIHFNVDVHSIRCTSTDLIRFTQTTAVARTQQVGDFILPNQMIRAINAIPLAISDTSSVTLVVAGSLLQVQFHDVKLTLTIRCVAEPFPNLQQAIDKVNAVEGTIVKIDTNEFRRQLDRVLPYVDIKAPSIRLTFKGDTLTGSIESKDVGEGKFEIAVIIHDDSLDSGVAPDPTLLRQVLSAIDLDHTIALDPKLLRQVLGAIGYAEVQVKLPTDPHLPICITRNLADDPFFHVLAVQQIRS
jgi:DNA polymerase III sliding clamp (beta) subunit (PCNA family)